MGQRNRAGQTSCTLFYPGRLEGCHFSEVEPSSRDRFSVGHDMTAAAAQAQGASRASNCTELLQAQDAKSGRGLQGATR